MALNDPKISKADMDAAIAAAEAKYGDKLPKGLLRDMANVESTYGSRLIPRDKNGKIVSSARGPWQFLEGTGKEFGLNTEADRMDPYKAADAAARLMIRNRTQLEKSLGRSVTNGELYLAHQQGAGGAAKLLRDPTANAVKLLGRDQVLLNGGNENTTAGELVKKWTSKFGGGAATAPAKKPQASSLGRLPGVTAERDFYDFNGADLAKLDANTRAMQQLGDAPKPKSSLGEVPQVQATRLSDIVRGTPEQVAERMESPADDLRSRKNTAILAGLSTLQKTASRLADPLTNIEATDDTVAAPSGIPGQFSAGVTAGLQNMSADQEYFGAIIDTLTGNEAGAKSRIFNAQQFEADSARSLAGMQNFEEFLNEPTVDGFITQVVSAAGQVAPSALESIASALVTGGMYTLAKQGISTGTKVVAKTLVKDLLAKKAKGKALDASEDGILDNLYKNFKHGAMAGAFGSEYRMMSGAAFSEFGDAGVDMDAERAFQSLLIGAPQAAIGVGGEFAILKALGGLATKKATRSAETSILKKFAQDVTRMGLKAGALEGATETAQEGISVLQRASVDPEFTLQDAQLRLGQAAFAGFFGGGLFGGAAGIPAAGSSAVRSTKIMDLSKKFLKDASEARVETEVQNETMGVDDAALSGNATPEAMSDIEAQVENMLNPDSPKSAAFASIDPATPPAVEPGQIAEVEIEDGPHKGEKVTLGHIPGKGLIISKDPTIVADVMTTHEIGGDVDAAIGEAIGYVGSKDGDQVVRVRDAEGNVVDEAITDEENKLAAAERAEKIAATVPGAQVDMPTVEQAMEERAAKFLGDKKEFTAEASAVLAFQELMANADVSEEEAAKTGDVKPLVKNMKLDRRQEPTNDDAEPEVDEEQATMFDELAATYAEADAEAATEIEQFNERTKKIAPEQEAAHQAQIDEQWATLEKVTDDDTVLANYRAFKDRMPLDMVKELIKLNTQEFDGVQPFYDVSETTLEEGGAREKAKAADGESLRGKLVITRRDSFPNAETTVTRDMVKNVLEQVKNMPHPNSTLRKTVGKARAPSMFWLVNRKTDKAFQLNGTPKTQNAKGRTGIDALAQAGAKLNASTKQGLSGKGVTKLQTRAQGLKTMLKALIDAGYDLKVGKYPTGLVPFDQNRLNPTAMDEVVSVVDGARYTINDLLDAASPFEESKTSQKTQGDPNNEKNYHEEQRGNRWVKVMNGPKTLDSMDPNDYREEISKDSGPEEYALSEDKKKRINDDELEANNKEPRRRSAAAAVVVANAKEEERNSSGEVSAAELIEEGLDPLPDGASIVIRPVGNGWQATLSAPNIVRQTFTNKSKSMAIARAHQRAVSTSESAPVHHNTLAIESVHTTQKARDAYPEIAGVPAPKNQISIKTTGVTSSGTNKSEMHGKIGPLTQKILATALSKFNFHKPVIVMTINHLETNFEKLAGPGGRFEGGRKFLISAIDEMTNPNLPSNPARFLPGVNQHLILLRDDADVSLDINGDRIIAYDDAEIGATLAHELGHIVFKQEFESMVADDPLRDALWKAYVADVKAMNKEGSDTGQYTNDKHGFEEWYSDQVMAFIYRKAQTTKGLVAGYFTRVANAIHDFFREVNKALGGRLKSSSQKLEGFKVVGEDGKKKQGNVPDYFEDISRKNQEKRKVSINHAKELAAEEIKATEAAAKAAAEAAAVEEALRLAREDGSFQVDESMQVKNMILNLKKRIPAGVQQKMQTSAKAIMSSGTWGNLGHKLMNIVQASTDFMGLKEHGEGGKALKTFFGTLSQSADKLGWNKRELFQQNLWNNRLADIFGFNDKTNPKEWDSPKTRAIMIEAMDEDIDDKNLSTPEAKKIRELYRNIEKNYLANKNKGKYYIPNFKPRANYGGPRMWNVDKIAKNKDAFVAWIAPRLKQNGNVQARAEAIWETITTHTKDQVKTIEALVDADEAKHVASGATPSTPEQLAANKYRESTNDKAVMEMRDKIIREIRQGKLNPAKLFTALDAIYQDKTLPFSFMVKVTPEAAIDALKKHWMHTTETIRLTPGMDPALKRELAEEVKTPDAYAADPNDPNGWLLPPALAHSQYMHYIARRVEFEKMGEERIAEMDPATQAKLGLDPKKSHSVDYVRAMLHSIPEEHRMEVDAAIMANLGKFGENMNNWWRSANSVASVLTVFTTLLFTTLTSVTDFAGIFVRMKEFNDLGTYINGLKTTLTTREFQELARAVGIVTGRTQEHMMIGQGELDHANQTARRMTDAFFRYTGLEYYTKFVRSMAVGMGREFIINTANNENFGERETRYLAELGLTREDVKAWQADNQLFETPTGEKVRAAIARFADEAIIRPDASQRPTWASNPYMQMVWQLKSYYYGFGKTVLGGMGREMKNRHSEDGNFSGAAATAMLYASTIIPLTMMGMASRDWLKWLFQLAIPGVDETASTSMKLDTTGYMWEIFKRSGTMGPFALGLTTMEAFKFEGIAAPFTANVPMFDLFDDTIFDGDLTRPLPVINNIK